MSANQPEAGQPGALEAVADEGQPSLEKPARKMFVRRPARTRMPVDALARQGRVTKLAWDALGGRDAVLAFLNTHHDALGGRPIDLALADATGLASVEAVIAAIPARVRATDPA